MNGIPVFEFPPVVTDPMVDLPNILMNWCIPLAFILVIPFLFICYLAACWIDEKVLHKKELFPGRGDEW